MLMGLFRDSVLKCFCHSCSVNTAIAGRHMYKKPLSKKINKKPRCKQPKKLRRHHANHATEIRAEEKSRGGMSYEVILSQAVTDRPASPPASSPTSQRASLTHEQIDEKLEQAENRRKTLEAERLASISDRLSRMLEAAKKRHELNEEFATATAAALDVKLDASSANREAHLDALRAKVADHLQVVEGVRKTMDEQTEKLRSDIVSKMSSAQENRDDHLRTIMAKLQAHEASVRRVRENHEVAMQELDGRIRLKQELAYDNREAELTKKLEALRQHTIEDKLKALQRKEEELETRIKEVEEKMKTKMDIAECNKQKQAEKIKKDREKQERRAEMVRANKERMTTSCHSDEDTSSG